MSDGEVNGISSINSENSAGSVNSPGSWESYGKGQIGLLNQYQSALAALDQQWEQLLQEAEKESKGGNAGEALQQLTMGLTADTSDQGSIQEGMYAVDTNITSADTSITSQINDDFNKVGSIVQDDGGKLSSSDKDQVGKLVNNAVNLANVMLAMTAADPDLNNAGLTTQLQSSMEDLFGGKGGGGFQINDTAIGGNGINSINAPQLGPTDGHKGASIESVGKQWVSAFSSQASGSDSSGSQLLANFTNDLSTMGTATTNQSTTESYELSAFQSNFEQMLSALNQIFQSIIQQVQSIVQAQQSM